VARKLDNEWVAAGIKKIKGETDEWYKPDDAEINLWRAGGVGAWAHTKDANDPKLVEDSRRSKV
jgi:hypothetical protein